MLRTFPEHDIRFVESLDGVWEFVTAPQRTDKRRLPSVYPDLVCVPSAWETLPGLESYRGKAWFRKAVCGVDGLALRLVFGGVSHTGTVFIDGKKVSARTTTLSRPGTVTIPGLSTGAHELVVEVDNTFGDHSALHLPNDYYTYGGLTRPVEMQFVPELLHRPIACDTPSGPAGRWALDVSVRLRNCRAFACPSPRACAGRRPCTGPG